MRYIGKECRTANSISILRAWVAHHLGDIRHERRVCAIATTLVRLTHRRHSLGHAELRLLRMAAIVHDVGRSISAKHHPTIGAEMILDDKSLPLKKRHRRALAYTTLHHRGRVPQLHCDPILRPDDDAQTLRLILAFLRAADSLDSRALAAPRLTFSLRGGRLRIGCHLRSDTPKARRVLGKRKKFRLLEELLGLRVKVSIFHTRLSLVA